MFNKGLILINAYFNSKEYLYQSERLKEEFSFLNIEIDIKKNENYSVYLENSTIFHEPFQYDFCIYLDKDKYL